MILFFRQTLLFSATLSDTIKQVQELAARKPFVWQAKNEYVALLFIMFCNKFVLFCWFVW